VDALVRMSDSFQRDAVAASVIMRCPSSWLVGPPNASLINLSQGLLSGWVTLSTGVPLS
jgi:hypothetical protein